MSLLTKIFTTLAMSIAILFNSINAHADIMTSSEYVMIMDYDTGDVLFEKMLINP